MRGKPTYKDFGRKNASVKKKYLVVIKQNGGVGRHSCRSFTIRDKTGRTSLDSIKNRLVRNG